MKKPNILMVALAAGLIVHGGIASGGEAGAAAPEKAGMLVPSESWTCGMPDGIPKPEAGKAVFKAVVKLQDIYDLGKTPYGIRKVFVTGEGDVTGDKVNAKVMAGGLDFQLSLSNGVMEVEQVFVLKTTDGKFIYVRVAGTGTDPADVRMVADFEAPNGSDFSWLNEGKYVGRRVVDEVKKTLELSVHEVSSPDKTKISGEPVRIVKPEGVPNQPWGYRKMAADEKKGDELIKETVTLGGSQSVGATKGGGRNIIPITGGSLTGKIEGKVLFGGADYQKLGNPVTLDARYLWKTAEGDVIIVRNAGPMSSLVPIFEVGSASKYAWLNQGTFVSSPPGMGQGGVSLTFYQTTK